MIFDVEPDEVAKLDSAQLVSLMERLLYAECHLADAPLRAVAVPLQITVADEGEDGRIDWSGGRDSTDYLPARFTAFQAKARNLQEASLKQELLKRAPKGRRKLNAAILEVLKRRGAYVVFCSHPFGGRKLTKLKASITQAIRDGGGKPANAKAIEVYDANRIAKWVNTHPAVALWLASLSRRRSLAGFQTLEGWGRSDDVRSVPWVDDSSPRWTRENPPKTQAPSKQADNIWTFTTAATAILNHLQQEKRIVRLHGPSGYGKSRFIYEVFHQARDLSGRADVATLIFADRRIVGDETQKLALEIADEGYPAILVVDDCDDAAHAKLAEIVRRADSRMRLVTINIEAASSANSDTLTIRAERSTDALIEQIAKAIAPKTSDSASRLIQALSAGFPRMAVIAARQRADTRQTLRSVEELIDRILWEGRTKNEEAARAIEFASLFEWVGIAGSASSQAKFIAENLALISEDSYVEHVRSFKRRGIAVQVGNFLQIQPLPLAARLAAHRLAALPQGRLVRFFADAPKELQSSLLRQLRWCDEAPAAREFAELLLKEDNLGNLRTLSTDFGAQCLDALVHVAPDTAMSTIERAIGRLSIDELTELRQGRRHLVWALGRLVFRNATFYSAARMLRRLAAAENESWSNNASGTFKGLFKVHLSGTESTPTQRLQVLDEGLASNDPREQAVCVAALDEMLTTHHFSRSGGSEEIGSGPPLEDWKPSTYGEIWDFHRAAISRLVDIALGNGEYSSQALTSLGSNIRGLISSVPFADIKAMIDQVVAAKGLWTPAIKGVNEWLFFDRGEAPPLHAIEIRKYFDALMPSDLVDLVAVYTSGWPAEFHDPDTEYHDDKSAKDYEYSTRQTQALAEKIARRPDLIVRSIELLADSDANSPYAFARRLIERVSDPKSLFDAALKTVESRDGIANRHFFAGLFAGLDGLDPALARECIRAVLTSPKLKGDAISLICAGTLQPSDINLVASLIAQGDVKPWQCVSLSYGRRLDHLPISKIKPLLTELRKLGAPGLWACMEILLMYVHGKADIPVPVIDEIKKTLIAPRLFNDDSNARSDGHNLSDLTKMLARRGAIDRQFAHVLTQRILSICTTKNKQGSFYDFKRTLRACIKTLLDVQPDVVWPEISALLLSPDARAKHYGEQLVDSDRDDGLGPGLICRLPAETYLSWVRKDPERRAAIAAGWIPIAEKAPSGALTWHSEIGPFLKEFAHYPGVLSEIGGRLHRRSGWEGEILAHLALVVDLLRSWTANPVAAVARWAQQRITAFEEEIAASKQRIEERNAGIS